MDKIDRLKLILSWGFRGALLVAAIIALVIHDWKDFAFLLVILFLSFSSDIIERKLQVDYPSELDILILIFISASMYLGEIQDFYFRFVWWDIMLHAVSGIIVGGIGFSLVFVLNRHERVAVKLSPVFVAVFAFCFAVAVGSLWEIFEFGMDQIFGLNMQKSGLVDTMWDLIVNALGAFVFSLLGYLHMIGHINLFKSMEKRFFKLNPEFKKR